MGLKIAVVGGGSTYTPELVEGIARRADTPARRRAGALRHRPRAARDRRRTRRADAATAGWPGRLTITTDRDAGARRRDFVLVQLRVGGQAARLVGRDAAHRFGAIGQETTGPGGFAKALRTVPVVLDLAEDVARRGAPGCVDRRLHEPGRDRHAGAARRRPPGHRPVQRGDRPPAPVRRASSGSRRTGRARARRPQPPDLDPRGPRRRRRSPAGAARGRTPRMASAAGVAAPSWCGHSARCRPTTCATTTRPPRCSREQRDRRHRAAGGHGHRARAARAVPRPDARSQAGAARAPRRRLLQRGGRAADRVAPRRDAATSRSSTSATTARCRICPTTRSWRCPRASTATARIRCRSRPLRPEMHGLVQAVKAYESWRSRRPSAATADRAQALLANPRADRASRALLSPTSLSCAGSAGGRRPLRRGAIIEVNLAVPAQVSPSRAWRRRFSARRPGSARSKPLPRRAP